MAPSSGPSPAVWAALRRRAGTRLGLLVELPVAGFPLRRQWHLAYPRDKRLGPMDEAFLAFIEDGRWRASVGESLTTD